MRQLRLISVLLALAGWFEPATVWGAERAAQGGTPVTAPSQRTFSLKWTRGNQAKDCPDEPAFAQSVEGHLGRAVFVAASGAELSVDASVELEDGVWLVEITLTKNDGTIIGQRQLRNRASTCTHAAQAAALAISLMIDPLALTAEMSTERAQGPAASPTPVAPSNPERAPPPPPRNGWRGGVELVGGASLGMLPGLSPGLVGRGRGIFPSGAAQIELEGAYFPARSVEARSGARAGFAAFWGGAALCYVAPLAPVGLSVCAGPQVGEVTADSYGLDFHSPSRSWLVNAAGRAELLLRLSQRWSTVVGADVFVPLIRDRFDVQDADGSTRELFRASPVAGGGELGMAYEF
jgi:hypothetical protein